MLGPVDRGQVALLVVVVAIACQLGAMGVPYALSYAVARDPRAATATIAAVRAPLAVYAVVATVVAAVVLFLLTADRPSEVRWGAVAVLPFVSAALLQQVALGVLQGLKRFGVYSVMLVAPNALFAAVTVGLWLSGAGGVLPAAAAWTLSTAVFTPLALRLAADAARAASVEGVTADRQRLLRFGRRSLIGASPPMERYRVDQGIVAVFLPPVALGYYVAALAFTNLPRFVAQSLGIVASPTVASHESHDQARRAMWRFLWISVPVCGAVVLALWLLAPDLTRLLFGPEFSESADLTRLLLVATAFFCFRRVLADASRGAGLPGAGSVAELAGIVLAIPLFAVFVPIWETDGVAYAMIASSGAALLLLLVLLLRAGRDGVPTGWREFAGVGEPPIAEVEPTTGARAVAVDKEESEPGTYPAHGGHTRAMQD